MRGSILIGGILLLIISLAGAVTLQDLDPLPDHIPSSCAASYEKSISGCTEDDFDDSQAKCSAACLAGLRQIAASVLAACKTVSTTSNTLLGQIFSSQATGGSLLWSDLCPNNGQSTSTALKQTSKAPPAPPAPSTTPTTASSSPLAAASSSSSAKAASSSSTAATQLSSPSAVTSSSTAVPAATNNPSSRTSSLSSAPTPSQSKNANSKVGLTVPQQQIAAMSGSGGGSPFDIVGYSSASRLSQQGSRFIIAVALAWTVVLLRQ